MLIESIKLLGVHSQDPLAQLINYSNAEVIGNVENKSVKQKNVGHFNKNVVGNCYENNYWYRNDKNWMLITPMSKRDKLAKNNELFFKKRLGFDAPFEQRVQVLS